MEMISIDIGCGKNKLYGAIGLDFSAVGLQDIAIDLNKDKIPFDDNSVDFVYSSHALEHLSIDGFFHIVNEIYRVLKPTGQVFLKVPYFTSNINLANPFHNNMICFNEHTFRFFSSEERVGCLDELDYLTPTCQTWGLRYSANSEIDVEFRTERIDFVYFPEFQALSDSDRRRMRRQQLNVVESIHYHLRPIKPCPSLLSSEAQDLPDFSELDLLRKQLSENIGYLRQMMLHLKAAKKSVFLFGSDQLDILRNGLNSMEEIGGLNFVQDGNLFRDPQSGLLFPLDEVCRITRIHMLNTRSLIDLLPEIDRLLVGQTVRARTVRFLIHIKNQFRRYFLMQHTRKQAMHKTSPDQQNGR